MEAQIHDEWDALPPSLARSIDDFRRTILSIREFMSNLTKSRWHHRAFHRNRIQNSLQEYEGRLDDASRIFEHTSFINIQLEISGSKSQIDALPLALFNFTGVANASAVLVRT
ncbi:hypothetical protein FA95DRAFT_1595322 [Auriscalpium vulgare]|uniref:Uncharacterized protein n=1 Tax=Auriscalpium vulgare TaxID=40419 RepID=A0ACB8RWW1_9AGAM|nr:hypothetical protein FA95DRAFT_1595322 [Auriscalpium vulgare]